MLSATLGSVQGGTWIARGAGMAILVVGVFAALNQLQIAPEIVNGLFYAILVAVVGSTIVAVGGGGIRTMQRYWERTTTNLERTGADIRRNADPEAGKQAAQQRLEQERARALPAGRSTCARRRCRWPRPPTRAEAWRTRVAGPVPSGPATAACE